MNVMVYVNNKSMALPILPANFNNFWHIIHYRKFATGRYIVNPPNMVCVTKIGRLHDTSEHE